MLNRKFILSILLGLCFCMSTAFAAKDDAKPQGISYYKLDPKILTNVKTPPGAKRGNYIQVSVDIMGADANTIEAIEHHEPHIRHILIMLFGKHGRNKLRSPVGQSQIRQQATDLLQEFMERENEEVTIENVLFTQVIVE